MGRSATALSWRDSGQSGVAAISVVVNLVTVELPFEIALVPKQSLIEDIRAGWSRSIAR